MIESASKNGVLVLATTNRREALDPAILRKCRFDHSVHVDYPTKEDVELALRGMLRDRPHNLDDLSAPCEALAGRPMSDVAWVLNEAARLTARAKRDMIEKAGLSEALGRLQVTEHNRIWEAAYAHSNTKAVGVDLTDTRAAQALDPRF